MTKQGDYRMKYQKFSETMRKRCKIGSDSRLYKDHILVETRKGNRLYTYVNGVAIDAALIAFYLHHGVFPNRLVSFADGNKNNLSKSNLILAARGLPELERLEQHERNLSLILTNQLRGAEATPFKPTARVLPKVSAGYMLYTYKGEQLTIPLPTGPGDDVVLRCKKVLADRQAKISCA
jgi:hypothetical protein